VKKRLRISAIVLAILVGCAQFFGPAKTNPAADPALSAFSRLETPTTIAATFRRACGDCHTNDTHWPWYASVAPVSWWTIDHVNHGRSHLNFSEWGKLPPADAASLLGEICEQIESGEMPLPSYLRMHSEAQLTTEDRKSLCLWTVEQRNKLTGNSASHEEHK